MSDYDFEESQQSMPTTAPNSQMALISLIAGILGWTILPGIASIVAIVTGHMAKREIRESNGALGGDGLATIGLVLGFRDVNNLDCGDFDLGEVEVVLDSVLSCGAAAAVTVVYKDLAGVTKTTDATATIATADPSDRRYLITLTNAGDSGTDDGAGDGLGIVYSVTCN